MADSQIDLIIADLEKFTAEKVVRLALDLTHNLVPATPIDIGWARAGWVPSIGTPYLGGADLRPDRVLVSIALGKQAEASAAILSYSLDQGPVFVSNNVRYIQVLNNGHSRQAPVGYVEATIERTVREFT